MDRQEQIISQSDLERATFEIITEVWGKRQELAPSNAELKAADLDRYIDTRAARADSLFERLDDPMLSSAAREAMIEELGQLRDELARADTAKRQLRKQS